jgi:hypothetical protein
MGPETVRVLAIMCKQIWQRCGPIYKIIDRVSMMKRMKNL